MKKILYIIPVLFLSLLVLNNVYGAKSYYSTVDDLYNYLNTIDSMTYVRQIGVNSHDTLKNSDLFVSTSSNYNYYVIFGGDVFFFNYLPTVSYFCFTDYSVNMVYLSLKFEKANVKYAKFSFDLDTGNPTSELSTYYVGSENYELQYGPSIGFYNDFFAKEDFYNLFDSNFELVYSSTGEAVVQKKTEFSFIPTYSENYETCNLKLDIKNPPDYYTLEYAINSSTSEWYEFDNSVGVTVENNCLVIVRMLDENGDEIFANSYNVAILENMLSSTYFKVDFDNTDKSKLHFTPVLYNNADEDFDMYFSLEVIPKSTLQGTEVGFSLTDTATTLWKYYTSIENYKCTNGKTYHLKSNGSYDIVLKFELFNKNTGILALTRTFKFNLSYDYANALESTTNGVKDKLFHTGGTNIDNLDESINNPFSNINNNSSFEDIASVAEESFATFSALFSILPGFIWALVAGAIGILIVLRVLGR